MVWLWLLCAALALTSGALMIKIWLLHAAAREIEREVADRLDHDTNTLSSVSTGDRHMRRLAAALNDQLHTLRCARRRFESGGLELKETVANISHDLRTPLTAICGYLELLQREELPERAERYLEVIENRTGILRTLTEELFCYTIAASTAGRTEYEWVSLNGAIEESLSAYYAALMGCGIVPEVHLPDAPVRRLLDRGALTRILGNVLSNAIKYSDGDLLVTLTESGEIVCSNDAAGLDEVQAGKLFDRFYTVEDGRRSTGLGLSIARLLTEQMGGAISAHCADGRLTITISFPEPQ